MNSTTKYNFEHALYNRKFTPKTLTRIRTFIFSCEANYIRNNETHLGNIPIELLIHILSFVMYTSELKQY